MCSSVVLTWILNSIYAELFAGHVFSKTGFVVWADLQETYDKVDGSVTFNLHKSINSLSQDGMPLSDYYHKLNSLWRQFDALTSLPACSCTVKKEIEKHNQLIKLMQFLMGLDDVYLPIRSNILSKDPLPSMKSAFAIIYGEESHRGVVSNNTPSKPHANAFVSKTYDNKKTGRGSNHNLKCINRLKTGHTIERCFDLVGYPPNYKKPNGQASKGLSQNKIASNNNAVSERPSTSSPVSLTNEQMLRLMNLINDKPSSPISANMAGTFFNGSVKFNTNLYKFFRSNNKFKLIKAKIGWIINSGVNQHMTISESLLHNIVDIAHLGLTVGHPNGTHALIQKIGDLKLTKDITLYDVLVVPEYNASLLSVHKLARDSKLCVGFDEHKCYIQDLQKKEIMEIGNESGGLYVFNVDNALNCKTSVDHPASICYVSKNLWHQRLGHPADQVLDALKTNLLFDNNPTTSPCEVCHKAKQTREPFPLSDHKLRNVGELVHLDLWGPYKVSSKEGYKYFLTIVDDFSRAVWTFLIKSKTEVYENIVNFINLIYTQFDNQVKIFRSDNGTEFVNKNMQLFCDKNGIIHQTSCAYTPQQNDIAERKHRHLLNVARSLMFQGGLPLYLWSECILTATYLINRTPSSVLAGKLPFYYVYGHEPSLSHIRVFGCLCFATILNNFDKFSSRSEKCVLIGYSNSKKCYKLLSLENKTILFSRDVKFYETVFPSKLKQIENNFDFGTSKVLNHENFFDCFENPKHPESPNDDGRVSFNDDGTESLTSHKDDGESGATSMDENTPPEGINETFLDLILDNSDQPAETVALRRSSRPSKVPQNLNDFVIEGKVKYGVERVVNYSNLSKDNFCFASNLNKSIEPKTYQEAILDDNWINAMNNEMEALNKNHTWIITNLPSNRKPIGCKWVYKIKYKSNGEIERYKARLVAKGYSQREGIDYEETFSPVVKMTTVRCLIALAIKNKWNMYQLDVNNAFLYGDLDENLYMTLPQDIFLKHGFVQSIDDHSLFIKTTDNNLFVALLVYVDDIVITGNDSTEINTKFLSSKFQIKNLGKLNYFLGFEILEEENGVCISQRKYCLELLQEFGMLACKPTSVPMETNHDALKVLRYLKGSPGKGLRYMLDTQSDPLSGKKQASLSKSSTESEYQAIGSSTCQIMWIVKVLNDLKINIALPVPLYCDNKSAIQIANNPVFHERTKHFEVDVHFIREKIAKGSKME
ncbi:putative RNA-directed DNA polymerase [Tanacetum coccineum]